MKRSIVKFVNGIRSYLHERKKNNTRSPQWGRKREEFLESHPLCEACGSKEKLQVHHVKPFHLHPELELEDTNLITLCMSSENCHLYVGHGDSFSCFNPDVREDAIRFKDSRPKDRQKLIAEIKSKRQK